VDLCQADQVVSVARAVAEALETDDAAQAGNEELDFPVIRTHRLSRHRVEIERRDAAAQDVNHSSVGLGTQVHLIEQVLLAKRRIVAITTTVKVSQGSEDTAIVLIVVGNKEIDVLGRANEAVRDDGKAADHHKAGFRGHHRRGNGV